LTKLTTIKNYQLSRYMHTMRLSFYPIVYSAMNYLKTPTLGWVILIWQLMSEYLQIQLIMHIC